MFYQKGKSHVVCLSGKSISLFWKARSSNDSNMTHLVFFGRDAKALLKHFIKLDGRFLSIAYSFRDFVALVASSEKVCCIIHSFLQKQLVKGLAVNLLKPIFKINSAHA